jgi:hypothetical protein
MTAATRSRLKFAALMTACGLLTELAFVAFLSPKSLAAIPWPLQAATGLVFFYAIAPWATMRLRFFKRGQE